MPRARLYRRRKTSRMLKGRKRRINRNKLQRQIHKFKRTALISQITASKISGVQTNIAGAYQFNLAQLPGVSEFSALFDQYKITGVKISFTPGTTQSVNNILDSNPGSSSINGSAMSFNRFHSAIDYDDSSTPSSEAQLMEYGSHKSSPGNRTHSRFIRPKILQEVYRSALATSYRPISGQYIDMSTTDVPHYGLKVWCDAPDSPTNCAITYNVYMTMYFTCKNTR